ncbi:MAG: DegT/DnrJ/EryC1/StrS family aminotransferase [Thermomicrobiales bacterium]
MTVTLMDVAWQHDQVRSEIDRALDQILTDVHSDGAELIAALENTLARRFGDGVDAITVQSGLAAEFLILKALDIGVGDEVVTVPNSDVATTAAISHTGARFVLVDVDPRTHNLDPDRLEAALTPRTRAIVPVHLYGLPAAMDDINDIAGRHGLRVIEDATLAFGAAYRGSPAGVLGDAACFSFAPLKVLGGAGSGGLVTTRDPRLAARVRLLKGYGLDPSRGEAPMRERQAHAGFEHLAEGYNLRLNPIEAAIIGAKLPLADEWAARRQAIANLYTERLAAIPGITLPAVPPDVRHAWRNYVVRLPHRDQVRARLQERGIATAVLYTPPVHLQPVYRGLGLGPGSFPVAEALARDLLCLPMHPGLTTAQVQEVAATLSEAVATDGRTI